MEPENCPVRGRQIQIYTRTGAFQYLLFCLFFKKKTIEQFIMKTAETANDGNKFVTSCATAYRRALIVTAVNGLTKRADRCNSDYGWAHFDCSSPKDAIDWVL
jgi:hypothetical protein